MYPSFLQEEDQNAAGEWREMVAQRSESRNANYLVARWIRTACEGGRKFYTPLGLGSRDPPDTRSVEQYGTPARESKEGNSHIVISPSLILETLLSKPFGNSRISLKSKIIVNAIHKCHDMLIKIFPHIPLTCFLINSCPKRLITRLSGRAYGRYIIYHVFFIIYLVTSKPKPPRPNITSTPSLFAWDGEGDALRNESYVPPAIPPKIGDRRSRLRGGDSDSNEAFRAGTVEAESLPLHVYNVVVTPYTGVGRHLHLAILQ
ncbi:hypothetical protein H6P81_002728 [Aristolochia fimbriata]|uniref:Uncharacterized protein n=1 Tax=Aristolochia fimbriata TaxID=158543 RepID=A0AAV7FAJ8_ARIFI|nr:hypothetical protein H6P81_002728 [Aristolochia fimbriata]